MIGFLSDSSGTAQATLIPLGTDTLGNKLIYDNDFNITWYDYSNPIDNWLSQWNWADALSVTFGSTTYTEWRLPTALNQDGSGPDFGFSVTGSEMGHLYYTELGNQAGGPFSNTSPFQNLIGARYWSWPVYAPDLLVDAWDFRFLNGKQEVWNQGNTGYALAVHPGEVPEPATLGLLLVSGLAVLWRRR